MVKQKKVDEGDAISSSAKKTSKSLIVKQKKIQEGDAICVADRGKIYSAKVIKAAKAGNIFRYFIHFQGWAKKYDTWVDEHIICCETDTAGKERLRLSLGGGSKAVGNGKKTSASNDINEIHSAEGAEEASSSSSSSSSTSTSIKRKVITEDHMIAAKKKRKELAQKDLIDENSGIDAEYSSKVPIPLNIKKHLVDEWSLVTGTAKRLINLPRPITVANIIEEFLDQKEKKIGSEEFESYRYLFDGFKLYFDKALPFILLYRQEREQFDIASALFDAKIDEKLVPSEFYGGEHLLRLFVRLQRLLSGVFIAHADMTQVILKLGEFLKWMDKHKERFFLIGDYSPANEAIEAIKAATLESIEKKIVDILAPATTSSLVKGSGIEVKQEEATSLSPLGRPVRSKAGKNKQFE